jgi:uncharacterized OB-fold protein
VPTPDSAPFWKGCNDGQLIIPRCSACGQLNWFPRAMCRYCSSTELEWTPMSGRGSIYSFSVVSRPPSDDLPPSYVVALVDLEEGVRMMTHIVGAEPAALRIGLPVTVEFQPVSDEIALPVFRPA